jgi:hypothetical protein
MMDLMLLSMHPSTREARQMRGRFREFEPVETPPHRLLLGPGGKDAGSPNRPDAVDFAQSVWRHLDDVEHLLAEGAHELLGVDRANAPDHAGRQVLLDAFGRRWGRCPQEMRLELLAVGAVVDPFARCRDPLTGRDSCGMSDHGHEITMPARLGAQNAEAVLGVMVSDALDEARQHFLGR